MTGEAISYILIALIIGLYVRKTWRARSLPSYSASEVEKKIKVDRAVVLLDVRTKGERNANHIEGSIHIPLHELSGRTDELGKHRAKEIICYCQSGSRSITAALKLKKSGFTVANMRGGIAEWNYRAHTS